MSSNLKQLERLLSAEIENYVQLKCLESEKTDFLIKGEIDGLMLLIKDQEGLANDLRLLEERRRACQSACAEENGLDKMSTLGDLVKEIPEELVGNLASLRRTFLDEVKEIDRINRNNEFLIKQNIDHIKELFNIMTGKSVKLSYDLHGENANLGHRIIMDQSA